MASVVKTTGLKELISNLDMLEATMSGDELRKVALVGATELRDWVRDACERVLHMRTWTLWKSIKAAVGLSSKRVADAVVFSTIIYASVHEFGAVIVPRTKKFLSWIGEDGVRRFAKRVVIPARPYFRPGIERGKAPATRAMYDYLASRISGLRFK